LPQTGPQEGPTIFLTGCEKEEPQLIPAPPPKVVSTFADITKCHKEKKDVFVLFDVLWILKVAAL